MKSCGDSTHRQLIRNTPPPDIVSEVKALTEFDLKREQAYRALLARAFSTCPCPNRVLVLGPGKGKELAVVRDIFPTSQISAVELAAETTLYARADYLGVHLLSGPIQGDYRSIPRVIKSIGGVPDIVLARAPRIIESVDIPTRTKTFNDDIAHAMVSWLARIERAGGNGLVTTYTEAEAVLLGGLLADANIGYSCIPNPFIDGPILVVDENTPQDIVAAKDNFVLMAGPVINEMALDFSGLDQAAA